MITFTAEDEAKQTEAARAEGGFPAVRAALPAALHAEAEYAAAQAEDAASPDFSDASDLKGAA